MALFPTYIRQGLNMNKDRRKRLAEVESMIDKAQLEMNDALVMLEEIRDEEQEAYDNLSEGLQAAERGERMTEVVSELDDAVYTIREFAESDVLEKVQGAQE